MAQLLTGGVDSIKVTNDSINEAYESLRAVSERISKGFEDIAYHNEMLSSAWEGDGGDTLAQAAISGENELCYHIEALNASSDELFQSVKELFVKDRNLSKFAERLKGDLR